MCLAITTFAALVTVCLRVYVRSSVLRMLWSGRLHRHLCYGKTAPLVTRILHSFGAQVVALITMGFVIAECAYRCGRRDVYLSRDEQIKFSEYNTFNEATLVPSACFSKIRICLFVLRLLRGAVARKRKCSYEGTAAATYIPPFS